MIFRPAALMLIAVSLLSAQVTERARRGNRPFKPFRLIGNIYYVGANDFSSHLVTTPEGHILINSGFEETVPIIRSGVEKLGFRLQDIKILLSSHAHIDHVGGLALIRSLPEHR